MRMNMSDAGLGLRDAVFLNKLGNDVQRLLRALAHAVTDLYET